MRSQNLVTSIHLIKILNLLFLMKIGKYILFFNLTTYLMLNHIIDILCFIHLFLLNIFTKHSHTYN